jgi:serpin B
MKSPRSVLALASLLLLGGCASAPRASDSSAPPTSAGSTGSTAQLVRSDLPRMGAGDPQAAGSSVAALGTSLWGKLPVDGNLVISPYSIYVALAMTRAGAPDPVAQELDTILASPDAAAAVTAVDAALAAAQQVPAQAAPPSGPVISPANSLWVQDGVIKQSFLDRVAAGFGAGVYLTDYRADPESSRRAINGWVSEHTKALIPELIPLGVINDATVLTLVNALYFAAEWGVMFTDAPAPLSFSTAEGPVVQAPAFIATKRFQSAAGSGWRSVTIPYVGSKVAMTLIVPDAGRFNDVQHGLDADLIAAAAAGTAEPLELTMPKFHLNSAQSMRSALKELGAASMFTFRMWPELYTEKELGVSDVIHQAVVDTDEKGTVAAAATAVVMETASALAAEPAKLTVDRPFFFVIHDTTTGAPLFLGRVLDPTAQ